MPQRVVTFDVAALLGVPVAAMVAVPYRDAPGTPPRLQGGRYLDLVATLPPGTANAASLHPFVYEAVRGLPARLRTEEGGQLHNIWGWPHPAELLSPRDPEQAARINSTRTVALHFDFGARLQSRVLDARPLPVTGTKRAWELLLDSTDDPVNLATRQVYDTLDAHPLELRAIVEQSAYLRRETAADPAPGWNDRRPVP